MNNMTIAAIAAGVTVIVGVSAFFGGRKIKAMIAAKQASDLAAAADLMEGAEYDEAVAEAMSDINNFNNAQA